MEKHDRNTMLLLFVALILFGILLRNSLLHAGIGFVIGSFFTAIFTAKDNGGKKR